MTGWPWVAVFATGCVWMVAATLYRIRRDNRARVLSPARQLTEYEQLMNVAALAGMEFDRVFYPQPGTVLRFTDPEGIDAGW
jgi:hypothetical protein